MNTITRVMTTEKVNTQKRNRLFRVTKQGVLISVLVIALLLSAFGVVYIKDLNRRLFIQYQALRHEKMQDLIQWGKLLLEQSTWSTQSRIQQIAQRQLGMIVPSAKSIVLVEGSETDAAPR